MDQAKARPRRPVVVSPAARAVSPEQQTPAMRREQAFGADDRWVGYVRTTPGEWSGWHHHGDHDSYFYVLAGTLEFEHGRDGETLPVHAGDFVHVPARVVHRERTAPGAEGELVLVRFGRGPTVMNVDGPQD